MDPIEETRAMLQGRNLSEVSRQAGMAYRTVLVLAQGKADDIYVSTYQRIKRAIESMDAEGK